MSAVQYPDSRLQEASAILAEEPQRAIALCTDFIAENEGGAGIKGFFLRRMAYERLGDWESALADCDRLISLRNDWYPDWYARGEALFHLDRKLEAAYDFDRAAALDVNHIKSEYSLYYAALSYYYAGDYETAASRCKDIPQASRFSAFDKFEPDGAFKWLMSQIEAARNGKPHKF